MSCSRNLEIFLVIAILIPLTKTSVLAQGIYIDFGSRGVDNIHLDSFFLKINPENYWSHNFWEAAFNQMDQINPTPNNVI